MLIRPKIIESFVLEAVIAAAAATAATIRHSSQLPLILVLMGDSFLAVARG
jgi:hypothetical protein